MKLYLSRSWRLFFYCIFLTCATNRVQAQNISKLEYFVDADPGFGLATAVPVTTGTDVTTNFQFNISALAVGFHNLYMRTYVTPYQVVADGQTIKKGGWSLASVRTFYKENIITGSNALPNVTAGEYFIDEDPGFGKATGFAVNAGTNLANAGFTFEVTNLTVGFHNLYVRFKDANDKWSLALVRNFYKEVVAVGANAIANIQAGEYFLDTDPGFGKAITIPFTPGSNPSLNFTIDITSLTSGFHNLYLRFKDANGKWSLAGIKNFYKEQISLTSGAASNIVKGEYFIDADPGFGNATNIPFTASANLDNLNFTFDVTSLPTGFHNLFMRFKNADGRWSSVHSRTLYKENISAGGTSASNITRGEYFIDADPGYSKGQNILLTPGIELSNLSFIADVTSINTGFHTINTRFVNANGKWSHTNIRTFYKETITTTADRPNLVRVEYYIDTDPGYGKGTNVGFTPAKDVTDLNFPVHMSVVSIGNHKLYLRALDALGKWSLISIGSFVVEPPSALYITVGNLAQKACAGSAFKVPFSVNTPYGSNNIFTAQLSDANGSFANPVNIGSVTGNHNDTIAANIPANAAAGNGYRIRILASSPFDTSAASSSSFAINRVPEQSITVTGKSSVCVGTEIYSAGTATAGVTYTWALAGGGSMDTSSTSATVNWTTAGLFSLSVTPSNACGNGLQKSLQVRVFTGLPGTPAIVVNDRILFATGGTTETVNSYQWLKGGTAIAGATGSSYNANTDGTYSVQFVNTCGAGPVSTPVTLTTKQTQTITFTPVANFIYKDTSLVVKAVASSGRPVTYSLLSGAATIKSDTLTVTGAGLITIRAAQAGNDTLSAAFTDLSFTVLKGVATMLFSNINQVYSGASRTVTIVTSPGNLPLVVTYNLSAAAPVNAGAYKVVATINSLNYTGVDSTTLTVGKASQAITLESIPDKQFTTTPFSISATATSGLPVTVSLTSNPAGIASINGNSITMTGLGTVYISATQAGNLNYNAAAEKLDTFNIAKSTQSINLSTINNQFINDTLVINANASSGLPVVYSISTTPVSGVAILKKDSIITLSDTGRVNLTLSQAGNAFYSAVEIQRTFKVVRYNQTITFNTIATKTFGDAPFVVVGTSTSGLPVTFRKISGPVTVKNDTVTLTGAGTVVIEANQAGNNLYSPANAVRQTFTVLPDLRAPDLFVQNVNAAITEVSTGDSATVSWKVANIGTLTSALNWTERIYMQSPNGTNRTLLKQGTYNAAGSLDTGKFVSRSEKIFFPTQVTIGDSGVFVVEVIADPLANEAPGNLTNNIGVQSPGWSVKRLLLLTLSEPTLTEGSTLSATISRTGAVINPLTVNINLKNKIRYTVPATVVVPAGQSGFTFTITAIENQLIDGTILDTLTVSASSFAAAKQGFSLLDNDKPSLTITELISEINEGDSVTFKVNTNAISNTATQVFLSSSNQARFPIPASVTIPAGAAFVAVKVKVLQNTIPEIKTVITIQAGAANHNATTASISVNDDDLPGLELVFETNTIAESAGFFATRATLRRKANSNPYAFSATISANVANALILPGGVNLAANENEKTFNVGVVDNTLVDGERTIAVTASIYVNSCGCSAPPNAAGSVTASIKISDNDGPALTLTASTLTVIEGQTEAGLLRITRNTSTAQPLIVNLSSSNTGEATLPSTATIPAGQAFVEVPITTINDNVTDGNKQVYFEATAAGFATGSVWVVVTDLNKPDFQITSVVVPVNALQSMTVFDYKVSVKNSGFSTAAAGVLVRGYLSADNVLDDGDSLLTEDVTKEVIKQGETIQIVNAATVPNVPGAYKLIFKVNPLSTVTELLLTNNTSQPVAFTINPDYTVTSDITKPWFVKGSKIAITGEAKKSNGTPGANVPVEVYVLTNGVRREIKATTNANGAYTTEFAPLANEVGHYTVGASYPGLKQATEQDAFDILGVQVNDGNIPKFKVILSDTIRGEMPIKNLSNTALTGFSLLKVNLPNAVISFDTIAILSGNTSKNIGFKVIGNALSAGTNFEVANLQAFSKEATIQNVDVFYFCQAPNGLVSASITNINVTSSQSAGEKLVEFKLTNRGQGTSGKIKLTMPQVNWLTSVTPIELPSLNSGDSTLVVLKFSALAEVPFNYPITGNIGIAAANGNSFTLPYKFEKVSESNGSVKLTITNQFTYYTDAEPKVKDAHVIIKNYYTGQVYADGFSDANGIFEANNIPEGNHRITVEKEKHLPYNNTIVIMPGKLQESTIFINYQAITFNWSVVPTAVQDQYDITLVTQFETNVPIPVVTIDMPKTMPKLSGTDIYAFNAILTNHGLITAKDVTLTLPTGDAEYEFVTNYVPADLLAQQSIQVPVIMRRRGNGRPASAQGRPSLSAISQWLGIQAPGQKGAGGSNCTDFAGVVYWYKCNLSSGLWEKGGTLFTYTGRDCSNTSGGNGGGGGIDPSIWGAYANAFPSCALCPDPSIFAGDPNWVNPFKNEKKSCVQCLSELASAIAGCLGIDIPPEVSCAAKTAIEKGGPKAYAECLLNSYIPSLDDIIDKVKDKIGSKIPYYAQLKCLADILSALATCLQSAEGRGIENAHALRSDGSALGNAFLEIYNNLKVVHHSYNLTTKWNNEYFGDLSLSGSWSTFSQMVTPYVLRLDSIPVKTQDSILQKMTGYDMQLADIRAFFKRWNTSLIARDLNILTPNAQYPGIINWSNVKLWSDSLVDDHNYSINKGFASVAEMNATSRKSMDEVLDNQKNAVCASVTVQFNQKLTMTREAFEGTLEIFNGHPTDKMDSLSVSIQITDVNGVPSNGLFQINTKSLTNLANVTGTGNIAAQQKGSVKFIFIPEVGAAPQTPKIYNFGGFVRYFDPYAKAMINLPLSNVPLTVNPSPNLFLHYFMERNILGDDALTSPEIEPSVPAELAVMVENQGYGPAVNMTISSAQPKIIDNEKGLAIEFKLIGSNFQGKPKNLGVTNINFGTIPPLQTRIGQWYLTSSLLGKFVSYQASVVHSNSFGNPDLSLVKGVKLHELTKSIRLYGNNADGINDFLVNDIFDIHDVPDIIYFSQGNRTEKVYEAKSGSFSSAVGPPAFTNILTVTASDTGWNYIKVDDPGNRKFEIVSVTRSDGQVIPLDNAWLTFVTLPVSQAPKYENKFHFVDSFPSMQPVTYTVVWKPGNVNVPKIVKIEGVNGPITSLPVTELTVLFDKSIDPTTFTYEDLNLTFQGSGNIMNSSVVITQLDTATFKINLASLTTGNGFYNLTVQAANVKDVYGINGQTGKNITWTQFLTVPTVQAFLALPARNIGSSFDTVHVLFNIPINISSVNPTRFSVYKDSILVPGSLTVDSVRADHKLFYLSGLGKLLTQSGVYELRVDLPNIISQTQIHGVQVQSVKLTLDNEGPKLITFEKSYTGGIDPQHVTNIKMKFDEEVFGFNISSLKLTHNGEVFPLGIAQLSNTDLKTWMAGNFGLLTYADGNYTFTVSTSGFTDALGNPGTETKVLSWTVNHSLIVGISNVTISPDKGFSATDKVTSGQIIDLSFTLAAPASQVTISQTDLSGENVLAILSNVTAGTVTLPLTLPIGGNVGLRITAVGALGGTGIATIDFFVDQVALGGKWQFGDNQQLTTQVDTIPFVFSTRLLKDTAVLKSIKLLKNGVAVPTTGMNFSKVNDTLYKFYGIRSVDTSAGSYVLSINLEKLHKYTSGLNGSTVVATSWIVLSNNKPPQANAGNDTIITKTGIVTISGLSSFDPEGKPITYRWVAPPGIVLNDSTSGTPTFTITQANQSKIYKFLLIVSDGSLFTTAVVNVTVALGEVLPLTLLDFVATKDGNNVALDWKTAKEVNVNKFAVEWSADGRTWTVAGNVAATNRLENTYRFIHDKPVNGDNFYRLRMIDHDGHAVFSAIRKVQFTQDNQGLVLVPNPSNSFAIVTVPAGLTTRNIKIYGVSGNLVRQFTLDNGINQLRINTAGLAAGMYTIHAGKYVVRMLVQH